MTAADTRVTVRTLPWYGASTELSDEKMTSARALELSGLDWEVDTKPLYFRVRQDGKEKTVKSSKSAVYRKDTLDELGVVGGRYSVFQNQDAFAFLDKLVESDEAVFEAAGSMGGGSKVFVVMKLPEQRVILGDEHDTYVLFITSHDGSMSVSATTSMVRLSCTNMFRAAMSSDSPVFKASHIESHLSEESMVAGATRSLGLAKRDQQRFEDLAKRLADVKIAVDDEDHFNAVMRKALPWASKATEKDIAGIRELWVSSETINDELRFTGWGLANATTEFLSHYRSRRSQEAHLKRTLGVNGQVELRLATALLATA